MDDDDRWKRLEEAETDRRAYGGCAGALWALAIMAVIGAALGLWLLMR